MNAKNPRITWGSGCWAECAKLSREKRASVTPYRNWIGKSILYHGQVFGHDERSPFILRNIVFEDGKKHRKDAIILLYRLDGMRGWVPCWEHSLTTAWAMYLFRNNNKGAGCTVDYCRAPRNRCAEVHRASTSLIIK